jgi:hypothetical protein
VQCLQLRRKNNYMVDTSFFSMCYIFVSIQNFPNHKLMWFLLYFPWKSIMKIRNRQGFHNSLNLFGTIQRLKCPGDLKEDSLPLRSTFCNILYRSDGGPYAMNHGFPEALSPSEREEAGNILSIAVAPLDFITMRDGSEGKSLIPQPIISDDGWDVQVHSFTVRESISILTTYFHLHPLQSLLDIGKISHTRSCPQKCIAHLVYTDIYVRRHSAWNCFPDLS